QVWASDYVNDNISTDSFYANEIPPSMIESSSPSSEPPLENFRSDTPDLLNASINESSSCWFAIRQEPTVYSPTRHFQLKYDIEMLIVKDNVVYSSGELGTWVAYNREC
ncbi:hypothetical protein, partial [Halorubrum sp. Atlit-26R]|uniref:hypothetical protein n=1 Tax=Halorubrum sp. Atlit-26R TaxID=2282128 RepID=UPI001F3E7272